jgi:hypothetical protein
MAARPFASTSAPTPRWLISQFWQNSQRKLHQAKKIVPEPRQPLIGRSSPWCGP